MPHTDTFIQIAEDSTADTGAEPRLYRGKKTIAGIEYDLLTESPYTYNHQELVFEVHVRKNEIAPETLWETRTKLWDELFKKSQPDLRASALTKRYGWGVHYNADGKIALYGVETEEYQRFLEFGHVQVLHAKPTRAKPTKAKPTKRK